MEVKHVSLLLYTSFLSLYIFSGISLNTVFGDGHRKFDEGIEVLREFKNYFFTIWTFMLHIAFVILAIVDESSKILKLPALIQKLVGRTRASLFNTLLFPSCLLVSSLFWTIWHIDRELIFPKAVDEVFPSWLNHTLHTYTLLPMMLELLLPKKYDFVQFRNAAPILVVYFFVYGLVFLSVYLRHGVWLYPIFEFMDWPQRILFFIVILASMLIFQKTGISIQNIKKPTEKAKIR
ncbi:hypothetical protein JTB14_021809 [Gonioctena quinquepunctata]|nr:hypothetical protein JTB14_021809 [Gonioctena quinquepunctata]